MQSTTRNPTFDTSEVVASPDQTTAEVTFPSLSIAIPALNESTSIGGVLQSFLATTYPSLERIYVVDGGSTDNTREIVQRIAQNDARVVLLDNPDRVQAAAMNIAIAECKSSLLLRADAHCEYASDYIERSVEVLLASKSLNAGGAQRFIAKTRFQASMALAVRTPIGSGGAKYRNEDYSGYAETVFLGCYYTDVLREIGGFTVAATPNEDSDVNFRLNELRANSVYVSNQIVANYLPRSSTAALFRQYYRYGKARVRTMNRHGRKALPLRVFAAPVLAATSVVSLVGGLAVPVVPLAWMGALGALVLGVSAWKCAQLSESDRSHIWRGVGPKPNALVLTVGSGWVLLVLLHAFGIGQLVEFGKTRVFAKTHRS
jgi:succinoglycan biosynthesis protein ExoA